MIQKFLHRKVEVDKDLRPHYFDPVLRQELLIDSGSQVTAFPPDPGDIEDKNVVLRAVNGTKIKTYGFKEVSIKINRKTYPFKAIKAQVESPVIGWDFMKAHKLDLRWGDFGDLFLYDRVAQIYGLLNCKELRRDVSHKHKNLSVLAKSEPKLNHDLPFQLAAIEALDEGGDMLVDEESIDILPDSPYKEVLRKYPQLLKQTFSEVPNPSNIIYPIWR